MSSEFGAGKCIRKLEKNEVFIRLQRKHFAVAVSQAELPAKKG